MNNMSEDSETNVGEVEKYNNKSRKRVKRAKVNDCGDEEFIISDNFWLKQHDLTLLNTNKNRNNNNDECTIISNNIGNKNNLLSSKLNAYSATSVVPCMQTNDNSNISSPNHEIFEIVHLFPKELLGRNGRLCRRNGLLRGCVSSVLRNIDFADPDSAIRIEASALISRNCSMSGTRILIPQHTCMFIEKNSNKNIDSSVSRGDISSTTTSSTFCNNNNSMFCRKCTINNGSINNCSGLISCNNNSNNNLNLHLCFNNKNLCDVSNKSICSTNSNQQSSTNCNNIQKCYKTSPPSVSTIAYSCSSSTTGSSPRIGNEKNNSKNGNKNKKNKNKNNNECISIANNYTLVVTKPSYVLLWRYVCRVNERSLQNNFSSIRGGASNRCNNIKYVSIESQFIPVKWFGEDYERQKGDLYFHKMHVLDQIRCVRTYERARCVAWCLAANLEVALNEIGIQNFYVKEITEGEYKGFPEPSMNEVNLPLNNAVKFVVDFTNYRQIYFYTLH